MIEWMWVLAAAPGIAAIVLILIRRQEQEDRDAQLEELQLLSRSVVDAEIEAIQDRLAELYDTRSRERAELAQLREEVAGLREWVAALLAQIREAKLIPVAAPVKRPPAVTHNNAGLRITVIQQKMIKHFSLEELDDLVFQLGVDAETVWSGAATLRTRARALIRYLERHGRLDELIALCVELRPGVEW